MYCFLPVGYRILSPTGLKFHGRRRNVVRMRYIAWFGMSAFLVFLAGGQLSFSKLGATATSTNRDTLQKLYGSPVSEVFRTSQGLMINASFASTGNLCRAHITSDGNAGITDSQLNVVLDELVPNEVRGKYKLGTSLNVICLKLPKPEESPTNSSGELVVDPCAECFGSSEDYERVNITRYGITNEYSSVQITFHQPECDGLDSAHH